MRACALTCIQHLDVIFLKRHILGDGFHRLRVDGRANGRNRSPFSNKNGRGLRTGKCLLVSRQVWIFFRLSFGNCINCLFICVDLLFIIFFIPRFKCTKFLNSSSFLTQLLTVHSLFQLKANSHEIKFQRVISRFRNRKGNWSSFVNLLHKRWILLLLLIIITCLNGMTISVIKTAINMGQCGSWIVHSPIFFRKMFEIKRLPLREAIPPSPTWIKPWRLTHTSVHLKSKWPPVMLSARSRRSYGKIGVYAGTV